MHLSTDLITKDDSWTLKSDKDVVPWVEPYRVKTLFAFEKTILDYTTVQAGELLIKADRTLKQLNFDINDRGELIVIGDDADNYSIDQNTGELLYNSSGGIGDMIIESTFEVF